MPELEGEVHEPYGDILILFWYLFSTSKTNNTVKQVNLVSTLRSLQSLSTENIHAIQVYVVPFSSTYYMLAMNYVKHFGKYIMKLIF